MTPNDSVTARIRAPTKPSEVILDLPPGTVDTQLTLVQSLPLSGAVIVTTPQHVSLKIARRGLRMFQAVHVPILGVIENMSTFSCLHCGKGTEVSGKGGGERMSRQTSPVLWLPRPI
jgi:ATP-binding protein involved in chromosome partitioning